MGVEDGDSGGPLAFRKDGTVIAWPCRGRLYPFRHAKKHRYGQNNLDAADERTSQRRSSHVPTLSFAQDHEEDHGGTIASHPAPQTTIASPCMSIDFVYSTAQHKLSHQGK